MDEVEVLCDTITILKDGNFIFKGTVQEAIHQSPYDNLEEANIYFSSLKDLIKNNDLENLSSTLLKNCQ